MSLKENMSSIKEEISTQEQFFESFFKIEKLYKKYKLYIIGLAVALVSGLIIMTIVNFVNEKNLQTSNNAYNKVLANNNDKDSLNELKSTNEKLYNIALFQISKDKTTASNVEYLQDIALYNEAVKKGDIAALDTMILKQDFLLKDFAIISKTLILIDKKDYKKAKVTIAKIDAKSRVLPLSDMLQHFLLTK
ncbi:MAG: hypothetical protein HY307_01145 [Arcobacter sp.]|nr:hypothetical protein [Arcobacter sp.]